jgi:hypothetical protein
MSLPIKIEEVESRIIGIRDQKVILDRDVAALYGVTTKEVNQAVRNNPDKFPEGYIIVLSKGEKEEVVKNFDHLQKLKFSPQLPKAFTEKGLYMMATVLKSEKATQTTIAIIETFSRIKELSKNVRVLSQLKDETQRQGMLQKSGELIAQLLEDDLSLNEKETTIELNFAVLKFKHTVKRKKEK